MIHNIPKPELSPNFTIEDIHKIREWNYERMKDATQEEYREESKKGMNNAIKMLNLVFDPNKNCYMHYPKK